MEKIHEINKSQKEVPNRKWDTKEPGLALPVKRRVEVVSGVIEKMILYLS